VTLTPSALSRAAITDPMKPVAPISRTCIADHSANRTHVFRLADASGLSALRNQSECRVGLQAAVLLLRILWNREAHKMPFLGEGGCAWR
jgi:hypothetical protein